LIALCVLAAVARDASADTCVYTDRGHAVDVGNAAAVRVVELDTATRLLAELAANLPSDPAQATTIVRERLKRGGAGLERRLRNAYQGVTEAWSLGIIKIPAVVVDRRYVVYGEADVERALARIEEYRRTSR
jgi:integrating conjugative element protein (TIGR03757 family)